MVLSTTQAEGDQEKMTRQVLPGDVFGKSYAARWDENGYKDTCEAYSKSQLGAIDRHTFDGIVAKWKRETAQEHIANPNNPNNTNNPNNPNNTNPNHPNPVGIRRFLPQIN